MVHAVNTDTFRLKVGGLDCPIISNYEVNAGVFEVPSQFNMTIGHAGLLTELLHNYCEFTPFELFVNDVRVCQGEIDDLATVGSVGTELKVSGRDLLKRLVDSEVDNDETFSEISFTQLTEIALARVGLGDATLFSDNLANRKAITGTYKVQEIVSKAEESTDTDLSETIQTRTKTVHKSLAIETGNSWWDVLVQQYQRGGLFLWHAAIGGFVLGQPNGHQKPLYRILRRRGKDGTTGEVTVLGQPDFNRSARPRYSEYHVTGRKGTGKDGRGKAFYKHIDKEIVDLLGKDAFDKPIPRVKVFRDDKIKTPEQAKFLALRKCAEARRNAFSLTYPVSGHTAPSITGGGHLIWQPDTVVEVIDEELGIEGPMYVSACKYGRQPQSWTKVTVMRCEDLLFGEEDIDAKPRTAKHGGAVDLQQKPIDQWTDRQAAAERFVRENFGIPAGPTDLLEGLRK